MTRMPADPFVTRLNEQIAHEFAAHQQYVACAVFYDGETLPQLAGFFYRQALEERDHAMMMVQYLLDADAAPVVPGVAAPQTAFSDVVEPVVLALEQERRVTQQINALAATARADLAAVLARAGRDAEAQAMLAPALDALTRLGAAPELARAHAAATVLSDRR